MATKKFILAEKDIPQAWYNVIADMPNKPMSPLNPATKSPLAVEDLYPILRLRRVRRRLSAEIDREHLSPRKTVLCKGQQFIHTHISLIPVRIKLLL